jgi:hypothetical protein
MPIPPDCFPPRVPEKLRRPANADLYSEKSL